MSGNTHNRAKSVYFAQPDNLDATGFYFHDLAEFEAKSANLTDSFGQLVEEFELQYIDGDQHALFNALGISQATLAIWFDTFDVLFGDAYVIATYLAEYGYDRDSIPSKIDDLYIHHGTASDYAAELLADTVEIPDYLAPYIDYEAIARDMKIEGEISEITHDKILIGHL